MAGGGAGLGIRLVSILGNLGAIRAVMKSHRRSLNKTLTQSHMHFIHLSSSSLMLSSAMSKPILNLSFGYLK